MQTLELDIALRKKQLTSSVNVSSVTNHKDISECVLDSQIQF